MERLKRATRVVFLAARRTLVPCCLFFAYILAVGAMAALDRVFHFRPRRGSPHKSFWEKTGGRPGGMEDAAEQS